MNEQTNPVGGVSQEMDDVARVTAVLSKSQDQPKPLEAPKQDVPPTAEVQQPESPAETDEVTPDDIPDETEPVAQPAVDEFEIVHDGQQRKLSRAETIKLAQQGFDYTQKTQQLALKDKQVATQLQKLSQIEQVAPQLQGQLAEVKSLESQLARYQQVNWVQLANESPGEYAQHRANYDVLRDSYGQAVQRYQHMDHAVKGEMQRVQAERLQAEAQRLPELVPEWKDAKKLDAARADITRHFSEAYGLDPQELNAEANTAIKVAVMYKAMKYDQLLKSKTDKSKQLRTAPPVTVPGAKSSNTRTDKDKELFSKARKTGTLEDAAALILTRMK